MSYKTFSPRPGVKIAYHRTEERTKGLPGVVFLGGFRSDMTGTKATFLEERCKERGQAYVRFDYTGHGQSSGRFEEGNISTWREDALNVIDELTKGPQILVGSSMGGWIALLLTIVRLDRVVGVVGIAPAPDFSEDIYHHEFGEEERRHLALKGIVYRPNDYGDPYPLTRQLFDDAKKHLLLHKVIPINCPVRIIQGKQDKDVPWEKSEKIKQQLMSGDVKISYVDDGDHRLSRPQDLELLDKTVVELMGIKK